MAEITKLITCIALVFIEEGTMLRFKATLYNAIIKNKADTVIFLKFRCESNTNQKLFLAQNDCSIFNLRIAK